MVHNDLVDRLVLFVVPDHTDLSSRKTSSFIRSKGLHPVRLIRASVCQHRIQDKKAPIATSRPTIHLRQRAGYFKRLPDSHKRASSRN